MIENKRFRIGIDVSRASREFHGIPISTRHILREFGNMEVEHNFILLHYPDDKPEDKFGIANADLEPMPYSGRYVPLLRIIQEQVFYPLGQCQLKLNVIWHPQNHGQFLTPVGYVCSLHDVLPLSEPELAQDLDSLEAKALYWSRAKSAANADIIITVSEFSRREIIRYLGVNPNKVVAINNGIDHKIFRPSKEKVGRQRIIAKYSLPERYVLTVGGYAPHKNLYTLIDAFRKSNLVREGYGLVMVGPKDEIVYTSEHGSIEDHVRQQGLENKVVMLSPVPIDDLVSLYNNAAIFAITSKYEGFGFPPLEAMACHVPVVASNAASIPEVCGGAALYADPNDSARFAIHFNRLVEDTVLRRRLIEEGDKQAAKFDWQITAKKTLAVLVKIASQRS